MWTKLKPPSEQMLILLAAEERALVSGELTDLGDILERKTQLGKLIEKSPPEEKTLLALRLHAAKNARLLEAAMTGMRSARERVARLRAPAAPMTTYGRDGQTQAIGGAHTGQISRRA